MKNNPHPFIILLDKICTIIGQAVDRFNVNDVDFDSIIELKEQKGQFVYISIKTKKISSKEAAKMRETLKAKKEQHDRENKGDRIIGLDQI